MDRDLALKRPLVFFDLETTGVDVETDRIVQIAVHRWAPPGAALVPIVEFVLDPEMPISPAATEVHGFSNADVAGKPTLATVALSIARAFDGADICGHNVERFDIPLLRNEMARVGQEIDLSGAVIDTLRIFKGRFSHTLECAHRLYVGEWFEGAHDAMNDVEALERILFGMLAEHPDLPDEPGAIAAMPGNPDWVDRDGKFIWHAGEAVFTFGAKTLGRTLREVAENDAGFLSWMLRQDFPEDTLAIVRDALTGKFPEGR